MKATVLIVDDNVTNTKLAADVLEGEGCKVERAADAEEAQQILQRLYPDVILMDIALPGMDGLSLTRKLKLDARLSGIPIVALTASAMKPAHLLQVVRDTSQSPSTPAVSQDRFSPL